MQPKCVGGKTTPVPQVLADEQEDEANAFVDNQMELIRSAAWEATHNFEVGRFV